MESNNKSEQSRTAQNELFNLQKLAWKYSEEKIFIDLAVEHFLEVKKNADLWAEHQKALYVLCTIRVRFEVLNNEYEALMNESVKKDY